MLGKRKAATFGVALPARQKTLHTRMPQEAQVLAALAGTDLVSTSLVAKHCAVCKRVRCAERLPTWSAVGIHGAALVASQQHAAALLQLLW